VPTARVDDDGSGRPQAKTGKMMMPNRGFLFVALTRARNSLHRMAAKAKGIWMPDERWIRSFVRAKILRLSAVSRWDCAGRGHRILCPRRSGCSSCKSAVAARTGTPGHGRWNCCFDGCDRGCPRYNHAHNSPSVGCLQNFGWAFGTL